MPTNLDYGYKKPNAGESGNIFCPIIENNWERISTHDHDGVNSPELTLASKRITGETLTAEKANWTANGDLYEQTLTMPTDYSYDDYQLIFRTDTGTQIYPTVEKVSSTQFKILVNDNSIDVVVLIR